MFERHILANIEAALEDTPVVLLTGARQVGKSTIALELARRRKARYLTFDDAATLAVAGADPAGFVADIQLPAVIDEVQRVPELMPAIKRAVDEARAKSGTRAAGLFLLTGSANIWTSLRVSESLAGRVERLPLWPLSQGELRGVCETFIDGLFAGTLPTVTGASAGRSAVSALLVRGGYPEAVARAQPRRRSAWFANYIATVLERDIRDLANIQQAREVPALMKLLASRVGNLLNLTDVATGLGMPRKTVARYTDLLEAVYLVHRVPAWRGNVGQRLIKSPKVWLTDPGLAAHLLGYDSERIERDESSIPGALFENFVGVELMKQASWAERIVRIHHYRTAGGAEVDIVIESNSGDVCGVEVKLAATLKKSDFRGLEHLRGKLGDRFRAGVVIYTGAESVHFGDRLSALPVEGIWTSPRGVASRGP